MTINGNNCEVCEDIETPAKYKCPKCKIPYCALACFKKHKSVGCDSSLLNEEDHEPSESNSSKYRYPTEDTIPLEKLQLLRHNKKLRDILGNPHLRTIMEAANNAHNPTALIHEAMLEPIFVEFADECLKVVQNDETNSNDSEDD